MTETFWGILIPFLGTSLGAACVFFMRRALGDMVQRSLAGFAAGVMVAITGGIGEALIATAAGLCVAIFALIVHTVFEQKMDDILTAIEKADAIISSEDRKSVV